MGVHASDHTLVKTNPEQQPEFRQAKTNDRLDQAIEKSLEPDSIDHDLTASSRKHDWIDFSFNQALRREWILVEEEVLHELCELNRIN
jgi:hypothetical protein